MAYDRLLDGLPMRMHRMAYDRLDYMRLVLDGAHEETVGGGADGEAT